MAKSYSHVDMRERALIEAHLSLGVRPSAIASSLGRSRSTITREMRRNGWRPGRVHAGRPTVAGGYRSVVADRRARGLAGKPRGPRKVMGGSGPWFSVGEHLRRGLRSAPDSRTP